ncbi:MAG TPA: aminopeptidase P N-terminal domain-containing protein [Bacteroidia bacterium]|nr:aminopeptidase P N-terminal domain-containing protein [Bacteroidia bacterium]
MILFTHKIKTVFRIIFTCSFLLFFSSSPGQINSNYKDDSEKLGKEFHKDRRDVLRAMLPDSSCAVIFSNPERNRSADINYEYHQDPDFYYLTGLLEPDALLFIWKEPRIIEGLSIHELIFVQDREVNMEKWNGVRLGPAGAMSILGIQQAFAGDDFETMDNLFENLSSILYKGFPKAPMDDRSKNGDLSDLTESFKLKSGYPSAKHDDFILGKALRALRVIKSDEEIKIMAKAADISVAAHIEMMKALKPGMTEYQIEAIGECVFKLKGASDPAYPSICGAAENSCILHYQTNRRQLNDGDLLLIDMGAEYLAYAADITRTLPVNGKFSSVQKKIYDLVLDAQIAGIQACLPGNKFNDPDREARKVLKDGLVRMNILKDEDDLSLYYPHGTSHYLGLDVHDAGTPGTLKPGMVITVEPGLYFPEGSPCNPELWNIGIRIEDDILITGEGYINLSEALPKKTTEIEQIMAEKSLFEP